MSRKVMKQALDAMLDSPLAYRTKMQRRAIEVLIEELDHIPDVGKMVWQERQPLTDEECIEAIDASFEFALANGNVSNASVIRYARVIEAKHGIKEQS